MTEITLAVCLAIGLVAMFVAGFATGEQVSEQRWRAWLQLEWVNRWIKIVEEQTVEETSEGRPE